MAVVECVKDADFIHAPRTIQRIEIARVILRQLRRFQIAPADIRIGVSMRVVAGEKMEAQPAAIGARDLLRFAKEAHEQEQHEIGIDLRLQLQIPGEILAMNFADATLKTQRGV